MAFVFNFVLPGPVGEGVAAWALHKRTKVSVGINYLGLGLSRLLVWDLCTSLVLFIGWHHSLLSKWGSIGCDFDSFGAIGIGMLLWFYFQ